MILDKINKNIKKFLQGVGVENIKEIKKNFQGTYEQQKVFVKIIKHDIDIEFLKKEVTSLKLLKGEKGFPKYYTNGQIPKDIANLGYVIMSSVPGKTIYEIVKNNEIGSLQNKVEIFKDVTLLTKVLHEKKRSHNDIKPKNILFDKKSKTSALVDFGASNEIGKPEGIHVIGTKPYIDPHRISFKPNIPQNDIYSLGIFIYELLTGNYNPTGLVNRDSKDWAVVRYALTQETLPKIIPIPDEQVNTSGLFKVICDCLDYDLNKRPKNTSELYTAVEECYKTICKNKIQI